MNKALFTYEVLPFQQRATNVVFNPRCNTGIQHRIASLQYASMPGSSIKIAPEFTKLVALDAASFIVGMFKGTNSTKGLGSSISKYVSFKGGLTVQTLVNQTNVTPDVIHDFKLADSRDPLGLLSLMYANDFKDPTKFEELEPHLRKGEKEWLTAGGQFQSYMDILMSVKGMIKASNSKWLNMSIYNDYCRLISWGERRNVLLYPKPPIPTGLTWKSTTERIRVYEKANPRSMEFYNRLKAEMKTILLKKPISPFQRTDLMLGTSSAAGTKIRGIGKVNKDNRVRVEVKPSNDHVKPFEFTKPRFVSNKKNTTIPALLDVYTKFNDYVGITGAATIYSSAVRS